MDDRYFAEARTVGWTAGWTPDSWHVGRPGGAPAGSVYAPGGGDAAHREAAADFLSDDMACVEFLSGLAAGTAGLTDGMPVIDVGTGVIGTVTGTSENLSGERVAEIRSGNPLVPLIMFIPVEDLAPPPAADTQWDVNFRIPGGSLNAVVGAPDEEAARHTAWAIKGLYPGLGEILVVRVALNPLEPPVAQPQPITEPQAPSVHA